MNLEISKLKEQQQAQQSNFQKFKRQRLSDLTKQHAELRRQSNPAPDAQSSNSSQTKKLDDLHQLLKSKCLKDEVFNSKKAFQVLQTM